MDVVANNFLWAESEKRRMTQAERCQRSYSTSKAGQMLQGPLFFCISRSDLYQVRRVGATAPESSEKLSFYHGRLHGLRWLRQPWAWSWNGKKWKHATWRDFCSWSIGWSQVSWWTDLLEALFSLRASWVMLKFWGPGVTLRHQSSQQSRKKVSEAAYVVMMGNGCG